MDSIRRQGRAERTVDTSRFYQQSARAITDYLLQELDLLPGRNYKISRPLNGPRVLTFPVVINPTYARKIMAMGDQLSMAARLDRDYTIRINRGRQGQLVLEIPKPKELWFDVPITALPKRHGIIATMGLDLEHRPALVDFSNPVTAHILIAGATGSGKTNCGRLLGYDLASQNQPGELDMILIDTRKAGAAWRDFTRLPHLAHPVVTDEAEAARVLGWTLAELDARTRQDRATPQIFIGIDEAQALLESEQFIRPIVDIASSGREYGVHLALLTQNPTAKSLGDSGIKRNLTARLVGRVDSAEAAKVATGQPGTGAEFLTGAGDMLLIQPGDSRRLMAALITRKDIGRLATTDQGRRLDLEEFDDLEHIAEQVALVPGRLPDPLEAEQVWAAMVEPDISQRELYRRFSIGRPKAKTVKDFAAALLELMIRDGYELRGRNEIGGTKSKMLKFPA
jgi:hypothetical protein